jgi:hypothetical protein
MATPFTLPAVLSPPLTNREAVADAMYRCALAFDTNDAVLFDSTFMPDGVFDVNGHAMTGLPDIHTTGLALIFSVDTTHMITNMRVHTKTDTTKEQTEASLTATVLSQHFTKDKGMEPDQKNLMAGSLYRGDLVKDTDGLWKFKSLVVKACWASGDWAVVGGNFSEMGE